MPPDEPCTLTVVCPSCGMVWAIEGGTAFAASGGQARCVCEADLSELAAAVPDEPVVVGPNRVSVSVSVRGR